MGAPGRMSESAEYFNDAIAGTIMGWGHSRSGMATACECIMDSSATGGGGSASAAWCHSSLLNLPRGKASDMQVPPSCGAREAVRTSVSRGEGAGRRVLGVRAWPQCRRVGEGVRGVGTEQCSYQERGQAESGVDEQRGLQQGRWGAAGHVSHTYSTAPSPACVPWASAGCHGCGPAVPGRTAQGVKNTYQLGTKWV